MTSRIKEQRKCKKCQKWFWPNSPTQKFCGSLDFKEGCSWEEFKRRKKVKQNKHSAKNRAILKKAKEMGLGEITN